MQKNISSQIILYFFFASYLILSNNKLYSSIFIDIGHNSFLKSVFYFLSSLIFFYLFFLFLSIKKRYLRFLICILFLISSFFSQIYSDVSGNIINIDNIEIMMINTDSNLDFFYQFKDHVIKNFFIFIVGLVAVLIGNSKKFKINKFLSFFAIFFFISILIFSISRKGYGNQGLPSQLQFLVPLPLIFFSNNFIYEDKIPKKKELKDNNIVLIIDESVSFKKLKNLVKNNEVFKFLKKSYSIHNCSAQSVFSFINGLKLQGDQLILRRNLWFLAKYSGYQTIYLSAQEKNDRYQYLQMPSDLKNIDQKMFFGNMTPAMRDQIILKELIDLITKKSNQFIVVIKNGSHFPYEKNLDQKKYDLKRNESLETIYKLSLKENTINFLEKLISSNNLNTEVLYFSDHGQSFKSKKLSHCNSLNPDIEEWEIPLLYYKGNKNKKN